MSKQHQRRQHRPSAGGKTATPFTPVAVRHRHDGWTPLRQDAFVRALAACANIEEACAAVGMSPRSYYDLRARPGAGSFRQAVDAALDFGIDRLADAMMGRALHGEATPIFYRGEQVGERRRYDNRLGMFILRVRAPDRYGKWRDAMVAKRGHPDGAAGLFDHARRGLADDNRADAAGLPRPARPPLKTEWILDDPADEADYLQRVEEREEAEHRRRADAEHQAWLQTLDRQTRSGPVPPDRGDDAARGS